MRLCRLALLSLALAILPTAAFAHPGAGHADGFVHGFLHPIGGLDHVLAMVAVGLLAARLGGQALWLVPSSFIAMMVLGGIAGANGAALPLVELGISGSILVLGLVIALGRQLPTAVAMAMVGFFGVFHGFAHGAEMPLDAQAFAYGAGFVAATTILHAAGLALGLFADRFARSWSAGLTGGALAMAGVGVMAGIL